MSNDPLLPFMEAAERDGIAITSTTDGYLIMVKRQHLQGLLLGTLEPYVSIGITTNGITNTIRLSHSTLQNELDAHPEAPMLIVIYTHQPIKN